MDMQKTGPLIRRLREAQGITQKALAEKLHVTDKAVSKWERCLSCPDVALLEPLAGQLGISVAELLQGELLQKELFPEERPQKTPLGNEPPAESPLAQQLFREELPHKKSSDRSENACSPNEDAGFPNLPQHTKRSSKPGHSTPHALRILQKYAPCICTLLLCLSGGICAVCDLAISGALTWSLYPIASLIFAWAILSPLLWHGAKGIRGSLAMLSLAIVPFLLALAWLLQRPPLFLPVSLRMAGLGLIFLWGVYWIFRRWTQRKMFALALCSLFSVFLYLAVNFALSRLIQTPFLDGWDWFTIAVFLCLAVLFLQLDRKRLMLRRCTDDP